MIVENTKKIISVTNLPDDYPYHYSIEYILNNFFTVNEKKKEINDLQQLFGYKSDRMIYNFRFNKKGKAAEMSAEKMELLRLRWGLDSISDLLA